MLRLSHVWPVEAPSSWLLCPWLCLDYSLITSLIFDTERGFRLILGFPCLGTGLSLFLRNPQGVLFIPEVSIPFGSSYHQQLCACRVPCPCLSLLVFFVANRSFCISCLGRQILFFFGCAAWEWNPASLTKDQTHASCPGNVGVWNLNHCTAREAPGRQILNHWTTREVLG